MTTATMMNYKTRPQAAPSIFERGLRTQLQRLEHGLLYLEHGGRRDVYGYAAADGLTARIVVHRERFFRKTVLGGSTGAAESYMDGDWDSDDVTALVRLFARNHQVLDGLDSGWTKLGLLGARAVYAARRNTRSGSRRNIADHYDLGNDFFSKMLDPTMTYSSAIFADNEATLEQASVHKLDVLCRKLDLEPSDHLLEIGSGWGSMAIHAAKHYGCRVTTTTISAEQRKLAQARVAAAGLEDRVEVIQRDYRDLSGRYDKIVSVEMIEAVGWQYYEAFFGKCSELLEPGGRAALQAITIADHRFERWKSEAEFIQRYIFPGSCIPSVTALLSAAAESSDLRLRCLDDYTADYARTLAAWRDNITPHRQWVVGRYGETFWRMWTYYLSYCEGGFAEGYNGLVHLVFEKERWA